MLLVWESQPETIGLDRELLERSGILVITAPQSLTQQRARVEVRACLSPALQHPTSLRPVAVSTLSP